MAQTVENTPVQYGPAGIGGWLLLPLLHLFLFIGINTFDAFHTFSEGTAAQDLIAGSAKFALAVADNSVSIEQWGSAFIVVTTICVILYPVLCLVQFLRKKSGVPGLMTGFYVMMLVVQAVGLAFVYFLPDATGEMGSLDENVKNLVRAAVASLIWIPYFMTSERVGNTFVR